MLKNLMKSRKTLTIFVKSSILDVWMGFEYISELVLVIEEEQSQKKKNSIKRKKQKKFGDTRKVLGIINESDLWWLNFPFSRRFRCSKEICDKISLSWNPFKFLFLLCISGYSRRKQKNSNPGNRGILYLQTQFSVSTS